MISYSVVLALVVSFLLFLKDFSSQCCALSSILKCIGHVVQVLNLSKLHLLIMIYLTLEWHYIRLIDLILNDLNNLSHAVVKRTAENANKKLASVLCCF